MNNTKALTKKFIVFTLYATPIIAIINGIILSVASFSIGQVFGGFVLVVSFFCLTISKKHFAYSFYLIAFFVLHILTQALINGRVSIFNDINYASKILVFFLILMLLINSIDKNIINKETIEKFLSYTAIVIPVSVIFSTLTQTASNSYGTDIGSQGYFISLNALTIVLLITTSLTLSNAKGTIKSWVLVAVNIAALFLLGSKSSYVFFALIFIRYFLINSKIILQNIGKLFSIIMAIGIFFIFFHEEIVDIIEYQMGFIIYIDGFNDLITYLLSGRNTLLYHGWHVFQEQFSILSSVFGIGPFTLQHGIAQSYLNIIGVRGIEMDFFEIFFSYGFVIVWLLLYSIAKIFFMKTKTGHTDNRIKHVNFLIIIIFLFSNLGGHVLTETIAATYFAVILAYKYLLVHDANKGVKSEGRNINTLLQE